MKQQIEEFKNTLKDNQKVFLTLVQKVTGDIKEINSLESEQECVVEINLGKYIETKESFDIEVGIENYSGVYCLENTIDLTRTKAGYLYNRYFRNPPEGLLDIYKCNDMYVCKEKELDDTTFLLFFDKEMYEKLTS